MNLPSFPYYLQAEVSPDFERAEALVLVRTKFHYRLPDLSIAQARAVVLPGSPPKHGESTALAGEFHVQKLCVFKHAGYCTFQFISPLYGALPLRMTPPVLTEGQQPNGALEMLAQWAGFELDPFQERTRAYRTLSLDAFHRLMRQEAQQFIEAVRARTAPRLSVAPIPAAVRGRLPPLPQPRGGRLEVPRKESKPDLALVHANG